MAPPVEAARISTLFPRGCQAPPPHADIGWQPGRLPHKTLISSDPIVGHASRVPGGERIGYPTSA